MTKYKTGDKVKANETYFITHGGSERKWQDVIFTVIEQTGISYIRVDMGDNMVGLFQPIELDLVTEAPDVDRKALEIAIIKLKISEIKSKKKALNDEWDVLFDRLVELSGD